MLSSFGKNIRVTIFGGSHESHVGVTVTGLPRGTKIDVQRLQKFLSRRAPGNCPFSSQRKEADIPLFREGIRDLFADIATTDGSPLTAIIENTDVRSEDYKKLHDVPRPGHADFTAALKYGPQVNMAGGGPFSARMTAPLCIAGGIALQLLQDRGAHIAAHIFSVGQQQDSPFDPVDVSPQTLDALAESSFPVLDKKAGKAMQEIIINAGKEGDSTGGIVEVCALDFPFGIGGAMYDGVESVLAPIFFGIPAVKGVEFGAGFAASRLKGSENNDEFCVRNGMVRTVTNNHGGILGGITSGMPLIARIAFKPTPSISREQNSVNLKSKEPEKLSVTGRHDPCVAVRAVPVVEAAMAIGLLDMLMEDES